MLCFWAGALLSCAGVDARTDTAPPPVEPQPPGKPLSIVQSRVVAAACPDAKKANARQMESAINRLVEPCDKVPGGAAEFSATLLPNGRVQLASPAGDPAEGVVPTCVLENQLKHAIALRQPCKFIVHLEARAIAGAPSSAAPDAGAP